MTTEAFHGELLTTLADPQRDGEAAIRHIPSALMVVEDGEIVEVGPRAALGWKYDGVPTTSLPGLIVPGFVDTHIHYPQTDRIAAHGHQLLDWLDRHIFPAELAFANRAHADGVADFFLGELLRNGTTAALVFATVHRQSVEALFDAALARDMRIVSGKVLMDRDAPDGLRDTVASGREESEALIARYRGRGRLGYAVTPRFALTSTPEQLGSAGAMLAAHDDVLLHTHLSENHGEIAAVAACFPDHDDYLDVYARHGLVGDRSVFAHGVHLDAGQMARMAKVGSAISFCPTSNLFLGSGLFDLAAADSAGVTVGMGTDVGAGTSFSLLATLAEAYKVGQLRGTSLDPFRALYLATLGGAKALKLDRRIGALAAGYEADFVVLDPAATPLLARRTAATTNLHDRLFALMMLGDDRAVHSTYLRGRPAHIRDSK
ncbi:guanine deaminase [Sphingomonas naphthae]|uniref:Guanine deaminase n=1 Tax=Sphingomonas naphthae TaxID=1813468 RepID=A0ABY7TPE6_9SPHN|nr:guanine deaminase [Sphingomonas naphthae]WCT73719.1 guanine deaminase [Sphingomonas naphthae]